MEAPTESIQHPDPSPKKRRLNSEMIVALAAIVVSVMTLCVYILQARIMMDQQHASVWPYVEWTLNYLSTDEDQEFYISFTNKGVGPALVKNITLYLDDKAFTQNEYKTFMEDLIGREMHDALWIVYDVSDNRVIAPGEEVKIIHVKPWQGTRIPVIDHNRIKYALCYCSVYNDCWTTDGRVSVDYCR